MSISWWSKLWNWVYWIWHRKDREVMEALLADPFGNGDDTTLGDIIEWIEGFEYRGDGFRIHWTQYPVTTVHRECGDCEDLAWLWYYWLTRLGYKPHVYKLYRRKWYTLWIPAWWHTITSVYVDDQDWVITNNKALKLTMKGYFCDKGYCTLRRVDNDIKEK